MLKLHQRERELMAVYHLVLLQIILLLWPIEASLCQYNCGGVYLWYPFGIGKGCYFNEWFEVSCKNSSGSHKAFLTRFNLELSQILYSLRATAVVNIHPHSLKTISESIEMPGSPFSFSDTNNILTAFGCDNYGNESTTGRCHSFCTCDPSHKHGCCDFLCTLPSNYNKFDNANISAIYPEISIGECNKEAIMVDIQWLLSNYLTKHPVLRVKKRVPVSLEWGKKIGRCVELYNDKTFCSDDNYCLIQLSSGDHYCICDSQRSEGSHGCTGDLICNTTSRANCSECPSGFDRSLINDQIMQCSSSRSFNEILKKHSRVKVVTIIGCSAGIAMLFLLFGAWWLYKFIKIRKAIKLKQKFFKKNGGLLLKQHLSSNNEGHIEKIKLFTSKELKKATDNYNVNRILGEGGQGTVYKGMLSEGRIVAIKRSKIVGERKVEEFINELIILSKINHRNVVQLLGCCLETKVPLLVYEFIPNGTLFQLIHDQNEEFPITWEMRLRIVIDVASVLSYLHSAASQPIYHRDIKSTNILLDDKYRAKVSDFGISRSVTVDQTHLTTQVQGTWGYIDPQYFQSSQFTEKSDVYSFGVVLAELLTSQKPIRSSNIDEDRSLVTYFLRAMEEDRLFEILDARVLREGENKEIMKVANITRRCLNLNGKMRPTMREVAIELAGNIRQSSQVLALQQNYDEIDCMEGDEITKHCLTSSSLSTGLFSNSVTLSKDLDHHISN